MGKQMLLIRNPRAGSLLAQNTFMKAAKIVFRSEYDVYLYSTRYSGDAARLVAETGGAYDRIVCFGGDGTLNEVINGLMHLDERPELGYIPAGTPNDFAAGLGLSGSIPRAARDAINGEPFLMDVGLFGDSRYFTYVASFGVFTSASYNAPQEVKNAIGYSAYLLEGIKSLAEIHPYRVRVRSDNIDLEDEFIFGGVSNSTSMGGILKLDRSAVDLSDGLFEVLLVKKPKSLQDLQKTLHGLISRDYDSETVLFFKTADITMSCEDSFAWTSDGEFAGVTKQVRMRNCHNAVTMIRPRRGEKRC